MHEAGAVQLYAPFLLPALKEKVKQHAGNHKATGEQE